MKSLISKLVIGLASVLFIFGNLIIPGCSCEDSKDGPVKIIKLELGQKVIHITHDRGDFIIITDKMSSEDKPRTLKANRYGYNWKKYDEVDIEESK